MGEGISRSRWQEARATAALNHPNILAVYDIGTREGAPYIVSELLEGEKLLARLNTGRLAVEQALRIAQPIADALVETHGKGISSGFEARKRVPCRQYVSLIAGGRVSSRARTRRLPRRGIDQLIAKQ